MKRAISETFLEDEIEVKGIHFSEMFKDTPLEKWYSNGAKDAPFRKTDYRLENLENALRLVTVYKYGGAYIGGDFLILSNELVTHVSMLRFYEESSLEVVRNGATSFSGDYLYRNPSFSSNGSLSMSFLNFSMQAFVDDFDGKSWAKNAQVIDRIHKNICENATSLSPGDFPSFFCYSSFSNPFSQANSPQKTREKRRKIALFVCF